MDGTGAMALVLAGGNGARLHPLTAQDAKPALPLARGFRLIDFALSNLVNSQISPIYVLVQYKPESLIEHLRRAWVSSSRSAIHVVQPKGSDGQAAYAGTADAVYQNLPLLDRHRARCVAVFAADHVYRMDVRQMMRFHRQQRADVTLATVAVPLTHASAFGVVACGADNRVCGFEEKPIVPSPMTSDPKRARVSMGNYVFNPDVLKSLLQEARRVGETDFGHHVLPRALRTHRVLAYDFARNRTPGGRWYEEPAYWRDVGTLDAYRAAQRDVSGPRPRFSLTNARWPVAARIDP